MAKILSVSAREILDSRGNPTVDVSCELESGATGSASVPSGMSKGAYEALELRDGDKKRYGGAGVLTAVNNINAEINNYIKDKEWQQKTLDKALIELDGTKNKSRLGANAILGVSMAFTRACAKEKKNELYEYLGNLGSNTAFKLPQPMFNIINGGKHADSGLDFQEFMIVPVKFDSFRRKVQAGAEIIISLKKILKEKNFSISVGDEGGFAPRLGSNEEALLLIEQAILKAGYSFDEVKLAMDVAASSFYENGSYNLKVSGKNEEKKVSEMISWYENLVEKHPIISIEDGLAEDDWEGFSSMEEKIGKKIKIVVDDLTVTNVERIKTAVEKKSINSVIIKLNQIGTVTETIEAILLAQKQDWSVFVSHRSGETTDTFISDLAVGLSCGYIKSGSLARGERVCKYNRLLEIEDCLQTNN